MRKKPQEEPQRRDPSPRTDRRAIDVTCTEQINTNILYNSVNGKMITVAVEPVTEIERHRSTAAVNH